MYQHTGNTIRRILNKTVDPQEDYSCGQARGGKGDFNFAKFDLGPKLFSGVRGGGPRVLPWFRQQVKIRLG